MGKLSIVFKVLEVGDDAAGNPVAILERADHLDPDTFSPAGRIPITRAEAAFFGELIYQRVRLSFSIEDEAEQLGDPNG